MRHLGMVFTDKHVLTIEEVLDSVSSTTNAEKGVSEPCWFLQALLGSCIFPPPSLSTPPQLWDAAWAA